MESLRSLRDYIVVILASGIVALLLRTFVLEGFRIPTDNMSPALEAGDYIFVNKLAYGFRYPTSGYASTKLSLPKRGDIAVFVLNADGQKEYIKRVVAIEGDKVEIKAGILIVNGQNISAG